MCFVVLGVCVYARDVLRNEKSGTVSSNFFGMSREGDI